MIDLDEDDLRQMCTESSFDRGERYFEEGRVRIKEATTTRVKAVVSGTNDYQVEIELDEEFSGECDCPYDWDGLCKHIVATFLAVIRDDVEIEPLMNKSSCELEDTEQLLKRADADALRSFLLSEMEQRADLRNRFKAVFGKKGEGRSLNDYRAEAESLYDDVEDHGYVPYGEDIDFSSLSDLAELYIQKSDFLEAAKIYQALSEVIAEKMDEVDDSDGNYGGEFTDSLEAFTDCIFKAGLDADGRRPYIKHLFDKYLRGDPDYFQSDYREALDKLCREELDWRYWKELLEPHMPGKIPSDKDWLHHHGARMMISMKLDLHLKLGEKDDFYGLIDKYYRTSDALCLRYAQQLLADGAKAKAVDVAEEGVAIFEDHLTKELRDFLSGIYKDSDPKKYRDTLQSLFLQSGDWQYYGPLKKASKAEEWQERLGKILAHFAEKRSTDWSGRSKLIDIYLKEKMYDQALTEALAKRSLSTLRQYQNDLAFRYPEQYFNVYRELIIPFADKDTGRKHYQEVVSYLKRMKCIEGYEGAVSEIVGRLRIEHKRKPAFIDEMKEL
ncbi:MAG: hypothetical protein E4G89_04010 [Methanothrix sp.]|nr:MAG: hypothetical protein E4G89_04010 [Methanothrix sp.]